MFDDIKHLFLLKSVDKDISDKNYDLALEKLNVLIKQGYRPQITYQKRGELCYKLLMYDDAYSDFTYVITHSDNNEKALFLRMKLNFEIGNYSEAISDSNLAIQVTDNTSECIRTKFLSYVLLSKYEEAKKYILEVFENNKFKTIGYLFNETAKGIAQDELSKALKTLELVDLIDKDNPLKIFNEASIYRIANQKEKEQELLLKLDTVFPKYFVSHFRFTDMYQERDYLETCFLLELKVFDKQKTFAYPMFILEGYKSHMEGHIIDSKEAFEKAVSINPNKPEAFVLLAQTLQLMSGYDNPSFKDEAEKNYKIALELYEKENLTQKADDMRRQIKHLNSTLSFQ